MILESTITCPNCVTAKAETMPTDACQFFYDCTLWRASTTEARRLLRILFVWFCAVSAHPGGQDTYMPANCCHPTATGHHYR